MGLLIIGLTVCFSVGSACGSLAYRDFWHWYKYWRKDGIPLEPMSWIFLAGFIIFGIIGWVLFSVIF